MLQLYGLQILLYSPVIKFGKSNKGFTNCSFVSWSCNSAYSNGYDFNGLSTRQQNWYIHMFIIVALSAVAEFIGGYLDYYPNKPIIHKIVPLSEFCTAPFITVVFVGACGVHKPARVMTGVMILHIIEELLAAHFGIIFYITPAGAYVRSAFYWIYIYYDDLVQQLVRDKAQKQSEKLAKIHNQMITSMAELIGSRDVDTGMHVKRTCSYVRILAEAASEAGYCSDILTKDYIERYGKNYDFGHYPE